MSACEHSSRQTLDLAVVARFVGAGGAYIEHSNEVFPAMLNAKIDTASKITLIRKPVPIPRK